MSTIITMNQDEDNLQSGETYRVRSRAAEEYQADGVAVIEPYTRLEYDLEDVIEHEGA